MEIEQFNILNNHLGYGADNPEVVFMGLEEACDEHTIHENYNYRLGQSRDNKLLDLREFHEHHPLDDMSRWFRRGKIQTLWNFYCQFMLALGGNTTPDLSERIEYQLKHLGGRNGITALLEFYPLPRPGHDYWNEHHNVRGVFENKEDYVEFCRSRNDQRLNGIMGVLNSPDCKVVLIHGVLSNNQLRPDVRALLPDLVYADTHSFKHKPVLEYTLHDTQVFCSYFLSSRHYTLEEIVKLAALVNNH